MIAKIFDKDNDGKLNQNERKEADEAVKNVSFNLSLSLLYLLCREYTISTIGVSTRQVLRNPIELCRKEAP